MNDPVVSVKEFLAILNDTLEFAYPSIIVEGEISGLKISQGKWVFFDLKDDEALVSCFAVSYQLKFPVEDGMRVRITGSPRVRPQNGRFTFTVRALELAGEGELLRAMALLKAKLDGEGLFEPARKRPLPEFPRRIGLVTRGDSAAYADFIKIINARWAGVTIELADVAVQGANAMEEVVNAIQHFNTAAHLPDVLVVIRGGGSLEDLSAFSTEPVARAISASRIPVLVGVGHEIDTSLADLVADVRAATPTDAARLVVPDKADWQRQLDGRSQRMESQLRQILQRLANDLERQLNRMQRYLSRPLEIVDRAQRVLVAGLGQITQRARVSSERLILIDRQLRLGQQNLQSRLSQRVLATERALRGYDPRATLERGYSIVRHDGKVLKSATQVAVGDKLVIELAKDSIAAEVKE